MHCNVAGKPRRLKIMAINKLTDPRKAAPCRLLLLLACILSAWVQAGQLGSPLALPVENQVPFSSFDTEHHQIELAFNVQSLTSSLKIDGSTVVQLPQETLPLRALELGTSIFIVLRRIHFDTLSFALWDTTNGLRHIKLAPPHSDWMFRGATSFQDKVALALLDTSSKSNLVILADPSSPGLLLPQTVTVLPNTDIDSKVLIAANSDAIYVTIDRNAFSIKAENGGLVLKRLSAFTARKWVELVTVSNDVIALGVDPRFTSDVQNQQPAIFSLVDFTSGELIQGPAFPFNLHVSAGEFKTDALKTADDLFRVFTNDLLHGENSGLLYLGSGQSEGRPAWAQTYYLQGWIDILRDWPNSNRNFSFLDRIKPQLKARLDMEMALLDRLLDDDRPGLYSKRYTLNREPRQFAAHMGRLLQLFKRYLVECPSPIPLRNYGKLVEMTGSLTGTIEEIVTAGPGDPSAPPGVTYLRFKKGERFQFDGTPLPFNQQNDWAMGIMMHESSTFSSTPLGQVCKSIFTLLLEDTPFAPSPADHSWFYWWGVARTGWTARDELSVNTPAFGGHIGKAAISYKSIDAQAIFTARTYFPELVDFDLDRWACEGVQSGAIHPFVLESLLAEGNDCSLSPWLALQQLRTGGAWEMQSSTWAIASLSQNGWLISLPLLLRASIIDSNLRLSFSTKPAHTYQVLALDTINSGQWQILTNFTGDGKIHQMDTSILNSAFRFFEVSEQEVVPASP